MKSKDKVLVGLSGGVDSAISAYLLLQKGFEVEGVFLKNWSSTAGLLKSDCPWLSDRRDALRVAGFLGIPLHTLDLEKVYEQEVMKPFFAEYAKGNTPNPDVLCNEFVKFGAMYAWAMARGYDYVATGHYARVEKISNVNPPAGGQISNEFSSTQVIFKSKSYNLKPVTYNLLRSKDDFKDQTYFLYRIGKKQLEHIIFPLGGMKKTEVKKLARKIGLPVADRKESMGLCFVGKVRLKDFLGQRIKSKEGKIKSKEGATLGNHHGLANYTIGQRQGIDIPGSKPYFVVGKDLKKNILYVTDDPEDERLFTKQVKLKDINWLTDNYNLTSTVYNLSARFRHQGDLVLARIVKSSKNSAIVEFKDKQKALASGQSLVLYLNNICLGGGVIV